ncbi:MAG: DUF1727 domain-containing protein, partial [Gaiellaceae bacterium]
MARDICLNGLETARYRRETPAGAREVRWRLPGLYNVYNELAAAALAGALGASLDDGERGLARVSAAFGRYERIAVGDPTLLMLLIKNPAGA